MRVFKQGAEGRRGMALVYSVFGAFVAASTVSVMFMMATVTERRSSLRTGQVEASYLAEGGVEAARQVLSNAIANFETVPTTGSIDIDGIEVEYSISDLSGSQVIQDASGIQTIRTTYEIEARAEDGPYPATARRLVHTEATPVFQFAVFYDSDLEVQPGPSMTLSGRVHANGNMHLGSGNTLTLDTNYVRAVGDIFRARKNNGSTSTGRVAIREWVVNPFDSSEPANYVQMLNKKDLAKEGADSLSGYDSHFTAGLDLDGDGNFFGPGEWMPFDAGALELWDQPAGYGGGSGKTVLTGAHGVSAAAAPDIGSVLKYDAQAGGDYILDAFGEYQHVGGGAGDYAKGYYHDQAGLTIIVDELAAPGSNGFTAYLEGGVENLGSGLSIKQALINAGAIQLIEVPDMRQSEGSNDKTLSVEVDLAALNASGLFPSNGLLYASHYGLGEGTDAKGIVLTNGTELLDKLTVVTDGSAYIDGDFNTVNKKGSAVIADAVNLFSNAWDGTKSGNSLPKASETTFNVAIITGNQHTDGSSYGGGFENLPRFHENWSGVNCHITGSFVNTWESHFATGPWKGGSNRYSAPGRKWNYDPDFNLVSNLPPFTPVVVSVRDVISW